MFSFEYIACAFFSKSQAAFRFHAAVWNAVFIEVNLSIICHWKSGVLANLCCHSLKLWLKLVSNHVFI